MTNEEPIRVIVGVFDGVDGADNLRPRRIQDNNVFRRLPAIDAVIVKKGEGGEWLGNMGGHYPRVMDLLSNDSSAIVCVVEDELKSEIEAELREEGARIYYLEVRLSEHRRQK